MTGDVWQTAAKWASCTRRVPQDCIRRFKKTAPEQGDVVLCRIEAATFPHALVEDRSGRLQALFPGDLLVTTVAARESTRWSVGRIPQSDVFAAGKHFTVLSVQGIVGEWMEGPSDEIAISTEASILGTSLGPDGQAINISAFGEHLPSDAQPLRKHAIVITGSSADAGKTTAGIVALRLAKALNISTACVKATGTGSFIERQLYHDAGAEQVLDLIDFGHPTTYPSDGAHSFVDFTRWMTYLNHLPSNLIVIECGGDPVGARVPKLLECIVDGAPPLLHISAASDCMSAYGMVKWFGDRGPQVDFLCGRCTDTELLRIRTEAITGIPAGNLAHGAGVRSLGQVLERFLSKAIAKGDQNVI